MTARTWVSRSVLVLLLVVLPGAGLAWRAWQDPALGWLPPAWRADWVIPPVTFSGSWKLPQRPAELSFQRDFVVESEGRYVMEALAHKAMRVSVNGREVLPRSVPRHWKETAIYDLTPHLCAGVNQLQVSVAGGGNLPALLVTEPAVLRTPRDWRVQSLVSQDRWEAVHRADNLTLQPGPLQQRMNWIWARWGLGFYLASVLGVGVWVLAKAACSGSVPAAMAAAIAQTKRTGWWTRSAVAAIVGVALVLQINNAARYPYLRGPDAQGHAQYVQQVARCGVAPLPTEGWQAYQPPLYYYLAAVAYRAAGGDQLPTTALRAAQYLSAMGAMGLALMAWGFARCGVPASPGGATAALGMAAFVPVLLYTGPTLSNDTVAAVAGALPLGYLLSVWGPQPLTSRQAMLTGAMVGLALLARYTGLFVFMAVLLVLGLRAFGSSGRGHWRAVATYVAVALVVSGWFYARNLEVTGQLFPGNWGASTVVQDPSFRTAGFYLCFGQVFRVDPEQARWCSWLDGLYATFWADGHGVFFANWMTGARAWAAVALTLAVVPTLAIVLGAVHTMASAWCRPLDNLDTAWVALALWLLWAHAYFTMRVPAYGAGTARYLLVLVPVAGLWLTRGRAMLAQHAWWAKWVLDGVLLALALIAIGIYRFGSYQG